MNIRELVIKLNYCILDAPVARNRAMLCLTKCSIESLFIVQKSAGILGIYKYIYTRRINIIHIHDLNST